MKIGLHIADFTWPGGPAELGVRTLRGWPPPPRTPGSPAVSVMDHVWQIGVLGPPEHEMLEAYTTLGYLAAHTSRVELLAWVTAVVYREPGHAGEGGQHARRAVRGPRLARHRGRVERGGGARARPAVPADRRAVRAAGGGAADLPADVERRRRPVRGQALPARAHAQLAAAAAPAAPADPDRRRRGEEDAAAGRAVRAGLQPVRHARNSSTSSTCSARHCAGRRPRLRRHREDGDGPARPGAER